MSTPVSDGTPGSAAQAFLDKDAANVGECGVNCVSGRSMVARLAAYCNLTPHLCAALSSGLVPEWQPQPNTLAIVRFHFMNSLSARAAKKLGDQRELLVAPVRNKNSAGREQEVEIIDLTSTLTSAAHTTCVILKNRSVAAELASAAEQPLGLRRHPFSQLFERKRFMFNAGRGTDETKLLLLSDVLLSMAHPASGQLLTEEGCTELGLTMRWQQKDVIAARRLSLQHRLVADSVDSVMQLAAQDGTAAGGSAAEFEASARRAVHSCLAAVLLGDAHQLAQGLEFLSTWWPQLASHTAAAAGPLRFLAACRSAADISADDLELHTTAPSGLRAHIQDMDSDVAVRCLATQGLVVACLYGRAAHVKRICERVDPPPDPAARGQLLELALALNKPRIVSDIKGAEDFRGTPRWWYITGAALVELSSREAIWEPWAQILEQPKMKAEQIVSSARHLNIALDNLSSHANLFWVVCTLVRLAPRLMADSSSFSILVARMIAACPAAGSALIGQHLYYLFEIARVVLPASANLQQFEAEITALLGLAGRLSQKHFDTFVKPLVNLLYSLPQWSTLEPAVLKSLLLQLSIDLAIPKKRSQGRKALWRLAEHKALHAAIVTGASRLLADGDLIRKPCAETGKVFCGLLLLSKPFVPPEDFEASWRLALNHLINRLQLHGVYAEDMMDGLCILFQPCVVDTCNSGMLHRVLLDAWGAGSGGGSNKNELRRALLRAGGILQKYSGHRGDHRVNEGLKVSVSTGEALLLGCVQDCFPSAAIDLLQSQWFSRSTAALCVTRVMMSYIADCVHFFTCSKLLEFLATLLPVAVLDRVLQDSKRLLELVGHGIDPEDEMTLSYFNALRDEVDEMLSGDPPQPAQQDFTAGRMHTCVPVATVCREIDGDRYALIRMSTTDHAEIPEKIPEYRELLAHLEMLIGQYADWPAVWLNIQENRLPEHSEPVVEHSHQPSDMNGAYCPPQRNAAQIAEVRCVLDFIQTAEAAELMGMLSGEWVNDITKGLTSLMLSTVAGAAHRVLGYSPLLTQRLAVDAALALLLDPPAAALVDAVLQDALVAMVFSQRFTSLWFNADRCIEDALVIAAGTCHPICCAVLRHISLRFGLELDGNLRALATGGGETPGSGSEDWGQRVLILHDLSQQLSDIHGENLFQCDGGLCCVCRLRVAAQHHNHAPLATLRMAAPRVFTGENREALLDAFLLRCHTCFAAKKALRGMGWAAELVRIASAVPWDSVAGHALCCMLFDFDRQGLGRASDLYHPIRHTGYWNTFLQNPGIATDPTGRIPGQLLDAVNCTAAEMWHMPRLLPPKVRLSAAQAAGDSSAVRQRLEGLALLVHSLACDVILPPGNTHASATARSVKLWYTHGVSDLCLKAEEVLKPLVRRFVTTAHWGGATVDLPEGSGSADHFSASPYDTKQSMVQARAVQLCCARRKMVLRRRQAILARRDLQGGGAKRSRGEGGMTGTSAVKITHWFQPTSAGNIDTNT